MSPPASAQLAWDLNYYDVTTASKETKRILHAQRDSLHASEFFVIVGPSGSGKTSLLRILAGRHAWGNWSGTLVADGAPAGRSPRRSTGYVFSPGGRIGFNRGDAAAAAWIFGGPKRSPRGYSVDQSGRRELLDVARARRSTSTRSSSRR